MLDIWAHAHVHMVQNLVYKVFFPGGNILQVTLQTSPFDLFIDISSKQLFERRTILCVWYLCVFVRSVSDVNYVNQVDAEILTVWQVEIVIVSI